MNAGLGNERIKMNLQERGYRFVWQDGFFKWCHTADIKQDAMDCTDMSDEEFDAIVREKTSKA